MTKSKKRGPGRPPLGGDAATETLRVRLPPADAKRWRAAAKAAGVSLSNLIRSAVEAVVK